VRSKWLSLFTATALCVAGGYALLSVFAGFSNINAIPQFLRVPGSFLADSFSWTAFYVPVYLFLAAVLAYLPGFRRELVGVLSFTILPFLTISLFLKLLFVGGDAPITRFIGAVLGQKGGAFLLLLLLVLELLAMFRIWTAAERRSGLGKEDSDGSSQNETGEFGGKQRPAAGNAADYAVGRPILLAAPIDESFERPVEEPVFEGRSGLEFPDLPPLGELRSRRVLNGGGNETQPVESSDEWDLESEVEEVQLDEMEVAYTDGTDGETGQVEREPILVYRNGSFFELDPQSEDEVGLSEIDGALSDELDGNPEDAVEVGDGMNDYRINGAKRGNSLHASPPSTPPKRERVAYDVPLGRLLDDYADGEYWVIDAETEKAAQTLKHTLEEFNIQAEVTGIRKGPVITMFEILPAPGVKLSKIVNLADNIALRLASSRVRIVAPIPGKHAVGIEVPNRHRAIVSFKEMVASADFNQNKMEIPVALGKDITGNAQVVDLVQTPHLLIAGATGSGKSVCVNSIICSVLSCRRPEEVKMILIDPKIVELKLYNDIPHLLTPVVTEPKKAFQALQYCIYEMERRYSLLDAMGVRDIRSYNKRIKDRKLAQSPLPYILIIIDEFADLMATTGKELESTLARLAAMSRAIGIHLVLATQRPSIDVITGLIKANIPSRIAFMVASKFDSRIIIDAVGAEKLLGRGDMLFTSSQNPFPTRIQGAFLSEEEVERVTDHVKTLGEPEYIDDEIFIDEEDGDDFSLMNDDGLDPMLDQALDIVVNAGKASASYLQRRLKIGYNRAARIVEDLEERGIVGPQQGSKPREVIHVPDRLRE